MKIAIINYQVGNIQSIKFALERLGTTPFLTDSIDEIKKADKIILPGVGEASTAMNNLRKKNLDKIIPELKQPILGICLGMQLMCSYSEENTTTCLGIFNENVIRFKPLPNLKIPHMGWNQLLHVKGWLHNTLETKSAYFVHSYYVPVNNFTTAITEYATPFSSAMQKDNFYAVQFHPEKSGEWGEVILKNFLSL